MVKKIIETSLEETNEEKNITYLDEQEQNKDGYAKEEEKKVTPDEDNVDKKGTSPSKPLRDKKEKKEKEVPNESDKFDSNNSSKDPKVEEIKEKRKGSKIKTKSKDKQSNFEREKGKIRSCSRSNCESKNNSNINNNSSGSHKNKNKESVNIGGFLFLFGMLAIGGCALMAHLGFRGRIHTVGIDLGTTFSVIAVNEHGTVRVIGRDGKYGIDIDGGKKEGAALQKGWQQYSSQIDILQDKFWKGFKNVISKGEKDIEEEEEEDDENIFRTGTVVDSNAKKTETDLSDVKVNPLIASIVYFNQEEGIIVGDEAKPYLTRDPQQTIYNAKRFIGQDYLDESVQEEASRHPYHVVPYKVPRPLLPTKELLKRMKFSSGVGFNLLPKMGSKFDPSTCNNNDVNSNNNNNKKKNNQSNNDENSNNNNKLLDSEILLRIFRQLKAELVEVLIHKLDFYFSKLRINIKPKALLTSYPENDNAYFGEQFHADGQRVVGPVLPPEDIGSYVVNHLKHLALSYLGHDQLTTAVIAVPAKFGGRQKQATMSAFNKAGLKVNRIIEEPTAAALAYGLHQKSNVHHILVYDFGGGTLDVSLLYVKDGFVSVMGIEGDEHLGGSDFDHCIEGYLEKKYKNEHSSIIKNKQFTQEEEKQGNKSKNDISQCGSYTRLMIAEDLKKKLSALSEVPDVQAEFNCVSNDNFNINSQSSDKSTYHSFAMSNNEFYSTCSNVFDKVLEPVKRILEDSFMTSREIDEVVMVGGTTRIPKINEMLKEYMKKESLNNHIDPDITVAVGVACIID